MMHTPVNPSFYYIKVGFKGVKIIYACFRDGILRKIAKFLIRLHISDWRPGDRGFNPRRGRQHSFVEIDHEIFSTVILSLPLIQEGQLSVSGERMCTILVNRLEDEACPVNMWLGKLTALDMTPLG